MGSVVSPFRFEGYKIDRINFATLPYLEFLQFVDTLNPNGWRFNIGFRQPNYFKKINKYVGGMDIKVTYPIPHEMIENPTAADQVSPELPDSLITLEVGIAGVFSVEEGKLEKTTEENLVKIQIPMILFPYLRSAITSICAHGGIGTFYFPLINVHELARNANLTITEIE